jgi:hypothetical protein
MPSRRFGAHQRLAYLLLIALTVISVAACQRAPEVTEQWAPPYLEMHLFAGKVQVQAAEGAEWTTMEGKAGFTLEERGQIIADAVEGAQLFLGDGSTLELDPGTVLELRNPRTLPRLQVIVQEGGLLFFAQKPSYEFVISAHPVTLLSVPSLIRIVGRCTSSQERSRTSLSSVLPARWFLPPHQPLPRPDLRRPLPHPPRQRPHPNSHPHPRIRYHHRRPLPRRRPTRQYHPPSRRRPNHRRHSRRRRIRHRHSRRQQNRDRRHPRRPSHDLLRPRRRRHRATPKGPKQAASPPRLSFRTPLASSCDP